MSSEILVLAPDPIKNRLAGLSVPAAVALAVVFVLVAIFQSLELDPLFSFAAVAGFLAFLLMLWRARPRKGHIELHRDGLVLVTEAGRSMQKWSGLARITLLEELSRDTDGKKNIGSHYLALRRLRSGEDNPDEATDEVRADTLIPIDLYISQHRYSGRSQAQEEACKSPQDLADTVNAWRDFALNLEMGAVPTPVLQKEHLSGDLELKIYSRPV
ncbi:hypothetical protein [Roseibium sp. M-1]